MSLAQVPRALLLTTVGTSSHCPGSALVKLLLDNTLQHFTGTHWQIEVDVDTNKKGIISIFLLRKLANPFHLNVNQTNFNEQQSKAPGLMMRHVCRKVL